MLTSRGNQPAAASARWRLTQSPLALAGFFLASVVLFFCLALAPSANAAPATVVSLTFDDGNANQMQAQPIMDQYGVKGTFYIISGVVGTPNYLTLGNLQTLAADGQEIAGHTVTHPDLTTVTADEAVRQICNSRYTLTNWGFRVTSFAYPYAALNTTVEQDVKNCGFNSARGLGDIKSAHSDPGVTQLAEKVPPQDPYDLAAVDELDNTWTLAQMKSVVTSAQKAGGWIIFTIHNICAGSGCDPLSITPTLFQSFVSWLKTQPSTTSVKTIDQVVGGTVKPAIQGPPVTPHGLVNASLETPGADPFPQCWMPGGWGTNTPTWTRSTTAHTGSFAQGLNITGYASGDAKLLPTLDLGGCSPTVTPGVTYNIGTWYESTGTTQFALYYRDSSGAWYYWTSSPWFATASNWTQATFTTPAVPAGATGLSFGLALIANGSLTTDDYTMASTTGGAAANVASALSLAPSLASPDPFLSLVPRVVVKPPRHARRRGLHDLPYLPSGRRSAPGPTAPIIGFRPGTRVAPPFVSDGDVTEG
jgi:peptidoglycan/xylan/chitin deacetylase (PgdA/CDA1 family)